MNLPVVAIIGKPNVGKSRLFNRLMQERIAITADQPGVTRDRIYGQTQWLNKPFMLIDTGGLTLESGNFQDDIKLQAQIAIDEADVILFMISAKELLSEDDHYIKRLLYKFKKPILLVINKIDVQRHPDDVYDYMALGFGEPIAISSDHGLGINKLLDAIIQTLKDKPGDGAPIDSTQLAIIGRPNVGKSSIINALMGENRAIVSPIAGTTRDTVHSDIQFGDQKYHIIDTAGIKRRKQIGTNLEKYSVIRTQLAIEKTDIVILVIDISLIISDQDTNVGGLAFKGHKPVLLVANKWDLITDHSPINQKKIIRNIEEKFNFLKISKVIFTTATTGKNINQIIFAINNIQKQMHIKIKSNTLNEIIVNAQIIHPPSKHNGGTLKIYYATQIKSPVPTFVLFVNNAQFVHFSYERFLINQIRNQLGFNLVPIKLIFRSKK